MNEQPKDYFTDLVAEVSRLSGPPAWELLDRAAREQPRDPRPLTLLGALLMTAEKVDAAEGAYLTALQRAPGFPVARFQLGLLQLTSNRPAAAFATWAPLEALGDSDPYCLFARGLACLAMSRLTEARKWLQAGMDANTVNPALSRDMQGFLDRIPAEASEAGASDPAPGGTTAETPAPGGEHFLVSTYGRKA